MEKQEEFWQSIENDEFFKAFLQGKNDTKIHEKISQGLVVSEQLAKLSTGIGLLDKELLRQVTDHYEDLLSQATCIEKLEDILNVMQPHIQYLLIAVERLNSKIVEPYNKIQSQTRMLNNLHATSDLLRRGVRISQLIKRLQTHMKGGPQELTKAARVLCELDEMSSDVDLSHLEAIDKDLRLARHHRADVDRQARQLLIDGLASQNHTQVENALLVFHNLGFLQSTIKQVMTSSKESISSKLQSELDFQNLTQQPAGQSIVTKRTGPGGPGRAPLVTPGKSAEFRSSLWHAIEKSMECVFVETKKALTLQKQLASSTTLAPHVNEIDAECTKFWDEVTVLLGDELAKASQSSIFIQQTLEGEYPKLIKQYLDMCNRMQAFNSQQRGSNVNSTQQFNLNRKVVNSFENAYLARSMSRLFDPVNNMFTAEEGIPSHDNIDSLLRTVLDELTVSMVESHLNKVVASNVANTIKLFCTKCEHQVVTGSDSTQFIEAATTGQLLNASLVDLLHYFLQQTKRRVGNINGLSPEASSIIYDALESCSSLAVSIIMPVITAIESAVEAILLTMHNEDFSQNDEGSKTEAPCSLYVKELQGFLSRVSTQYLSIFKWADVLSECVKPAAERCLDLFVRLACLIRPMGNQGRMKLAADFAQMEMAIGFLSIPSEMGRPYRVLRSLKPLLFQTPEDIAKCPTLGDILPHSLVINLLFSFGPKEMQSPHVSAGWSVKFYSQWLDDNKSERKRLELIDGALQGYAKSVSASGKTSFHSVYPIMVDLLHAGSNLCI